MSKKITKLVGLKKEDFDNNINHIDSFLSLRPAKLIPVSKPGDEITLTSIFLSSLRLIKEYRKEFFKEVNMQKGGQIYLYTEPTFKDYKDARPDGLILIVKDKEIKDAALLEVKNGNNELNTVQIQKYIDIAKNYRIPRLITISNQFVSDPTHFPIDVKTTKQVQLFHFSWSYLLTTAHILLFDNDTNIEDTDQVEIMREVVDCFENTKSGVCGFTQMKQGWKEIVDAIHKGIFINNKSQAFIDTIDSWYQEEKDMALILSRKLGVLVKAGSPKYKNNIKVRKEFDSKKLKDGYKLISTLKIKGAISDIQITAFFKTRKIEMSVNLLAPQDKKYKGQLTWLKNQLDKCFHKEQDIYENLKDKIMIEILFKRTSKFEKESYKNFDNLYELVKDKEIKEFKVIVEKDLAKDFGAVKKFVTITEGLLVDFYKGIVQHLKEWRPSAPKVVDESSEE